MANNTSLINWLNKQVEVNQAVADHLLGQRDLNPTMSRIYTNQICVAEGMVSAYKDVLNRMNGKDTIIPEMSAESTTSEPPAELGSTQSPSSET